jgi:CarD family transcriptional regulator
MSKVAKGFQVDQKVVYPSQGVGIVEAIEKKVIKGEKVPYYRIYIEVTDMTIMVPVDKAASLGVRAIVPKDEALRALDLLAEDFEAISSDWKLRFQTNIDLLKKGGVSDIAAIVRSLYTRQKVKELPIQERKLFESAKNLLEEELSSSLRKSKEEINDMIFEKLESR